MSPDQTLDDSAGLEDADPQQILREVASGAAPVREAAALSARPE